MNYYLITIVIYSLIMIGIGFFLTKKVKGAKEFFVAGNTLNTRMIFITLIAANVGAGSTVGVAGLAYQFGVSAWWWIGASGFGSIILAFWVGPKIYEIAEKYGYYTLGDYLENRYSKNFRSFISLLMGIGTLAIFGGQLMGIAWILQVVAEIPKVYGVLLGAAVVTLYSVAGGLLTSAAVNFFQVVIKVIGFVLAGIFAYQYIEGFSGLVEKFSLVTAHTPLEQSSKYFAWDGIGLIMIIGFFTMLTPSFFVSPGLIGKVYGAKNKIAVSRGVFLNALAQWAFGFLIVFLGMCAFVMFPELDNKELALPTAIVYLMPLWVSTIALAAIFSAEVSTADAVLYMVAGAWANDIYKKTFNPEVSDQKLLLISRLIMIVGGVIGVVLALKLPDIISSLTIFYTLMSVSLTVPFLFGLFTKTADNRGASLSSVLGISCTLYYQYFSTTSKGFLELNSQTSGIVVSLVVMFIYLVYKKIITIKESLE